MSIASEISRIRQNVEDSLAAVEDKGVTVPEGSTSDDLPGLIALIQGGAVVIDDTPDENGGIIRTITAKDIIKTQGKTHITPGDTAQTIVPDSGYTALSSVQIDPVPSNYGKITWDGSVLHVT